MEQSCLNGSPAFLIVADRQYIYFKQKSGTATVRIDYQVTLLSTDLAGADYLNSVVFSVR